jgi:copper chaperone CopZ
MDSLPFPQRRASRPGVRSSAEPISKEHLHMKSLLVLASIACLGPAAALACPRCEMEKTSHEHAKATTAAPHASAATAPLKAGESRVTIPISGMHCSICASRVKAALTRMDGVRTVDADVDERRAVVSFETGKVDASKMVEAIDALGFKAGAPVPN